MNLSSLCGWLATVHGYRGDEDRIEAGAVVTAHGRGPVDRAVLEGARFGLAL